MNRNNRSILFCFRGKIPWWFFCWDKFFWINRCINRNVEFREAWWVEEVLGCWEWARLLSWIFLLRGWWVVYFFMLLGKVIVVDLCWFYIRWWWFQAFRYIWFHSWIKGIVLDFEVGDEDGMIIKAILVDDKNSFG